MLLSTARSLSVSGRSPEAAIGIPEFAMAGADPGDVNTSTVRDCHREIATVTPAAVLHKPIASANGITSASCPNLRYLNKIDPGQISAASDYIGEKPRPPAQITILKRDRPADSPGSNGRTPIAMLRRNVRTYEEREAAYAEARQRILGTTEGCELSQAVERLQASSAGSVFTHDSEPSPSGVS